jgi:hypothetical protein
MDSNCSQQPTTANSALSVVVCLVQSDLVNQQVEVLRQAGSQDLINAIEPFQHMTIETDDKRKQYIRLHRVQDIRPFYNAFRGSNRHTKGDTKGDWPFYDPDTYRMLGYSALKKMMIDGISVQSSIDNS